MTEVTYAKDSLKTETKTVVTGKKTNKFVVAASIASDVMLTFIIPPFGVSKAIADTACLLLGGYDQPTYSKCERKVVDCEKSGTHYEDWKPVKEEKDKNEDNK